MNRLLQILIIVFCTSCASLNLFNTSTLSRLKENASLDEICGIYRCEIGNSSLILKPDYRFEENYSNCKNQGIITGSFSIDNSIIRLENEQNSSSEITISEGHITNGDTVVNEYLGERMFVYISGFLHEIKDPNRYSKTAYYQKKAKP